VSAFIKWAQSCFNDQPEALAVHLYQMALTGPRDAIVWDYMSPKQPIKLDSFLDIAERILAGEEPNAEEQTA
jgi:hypothetical protein